MLIDFTLKRFPITGRLKGECGLPFSCVVQPFADPAGASVGSSPACTASAEGIARCSTCYGYVNKHCDFQSNGWTCALCGNFNELTTATSQRYARANGRRQLPELQADFVELRCALDDDGGDVVSVGTDRQRVYEVPVLPACIALVDLCCDEDVLELIRSALSAALEALPATARFGLVTFSNKIGLYDCHGRMPAARFVPLLSSAIGPPTPLDLGDALPLGALLAPLASCKDAVAAAIDGLAADRPPTPEPDSNGGRRHTQPRRGFGGALQAVLRYLGTGAATLGRTGSASKPMSDLVKETGPQQTAAGGAKHQDGYSGARLMAFLGGPPDLARGATVRRVSAEQSQPADDEAPDAMERGDANGLMPVPESPGHHANGINGALEPGTDAPLELRDGAKAFYEEAAAAASALGVCVDVYALSPSRCGLAAMEPLASSSGGSMCLYQSLEEAALPQDVYRRLASPCALDGLLRIRTSPEFRVARAFGQLFADERYENLAHVAACEPPAAFAFDFEYASAEGFSDAPDNPPVLQVAFQYSTIAPAEAGPQSTAGAASSQHASDRTRQRFALHRRLRVLTKPVRVARSIGEVYEHVDADAVLTILVHKIGRAAVSGGLREARSLLQDWLVLLSARYNLFAAQEKTLTDAAQVDVHFRANPSLQPLPRLVHALLRSPLLSLSRQAHPDLAAAVHHLWASLPPDLLRCAIYPVLTSFADPDTQVREQHALSRAGLIAAGTPILLLDAFDELLVYYAVGYPPRLPFPPPPGSALRHAIAARRRRRRPAPALRMLRGGVDDAAPLLARLVEEPELDARGRVTTPGLPEFLERVRGEAWSYVAGPGRPH